VLEKSFVAPLISIVLPVFNVRQYLVRCLDSCLSQDGLDFELIFVNDCGSDDSIDVIRKRMLHDCRVKLVDNPGNQGTFISRRNGAMSALGNYVFFVDPDDEISSNTISELRSVILCSNPDIIFTSVSIVPPPFFLAKRFKMPNDSGCTDLFQRIFLDVKYPWWGTPGKLYKRDLLIKAYDKLSFIKERIVYSEDVLIFVVCVSLADSFKCVPNAVYRYWINPTSITKTRTHEKISENVRNIGMVINILKCFSGGAGFSTKTARLSLDKVTRLLQSDVFFISRFMINPSTGRSFYLVFMIKKIFLDFDWRSIIRILIYLGSFGRVLL